MFVIPSTKHIASRILDLPEPLRPVMALNDASHPVMVVRTGYDLNPASGVNIKYASRPREARRAC